MSWCRSARPSRPSSGITSSAQASSFVVEESPQIVRHAGVDAEVDDIAAAAPLQRRLVGADQVFGLFLELDVGVADQAEHALADDAEAGEQPVEEQADQSARAARSAGRRLAGQAHEALHLARAAGSAPACWCAVARRAAAAAPSPGRSWG